MRLATAKKADGSFAVDAVSTDGGGIPRNVLLPAGLALVDLGGLSLQELVAKISYQPARLLGLANKGSLTAGRDADITIVDRLQRSAFATIIGGQVCYMDGKVLGAAAGSLLLPQGRTMYSARGWSRWSLTWLTAV